MLNMFSYHNYASLSWERDSKVQSDNYSHSDCIMCPRVCRIFKFKLELCSLYVLHHHGTLFAIIWANNKKREREWDACSGGGVVCRWEWTPRVRGINIYGLSDRHEMRTSSIYTRPIKDDKHAKVGWWEKQLEAKRKKERERRYRVLARAIVCGCQPVCLCVRNVVLPICNFSLFFLFSLKSKKNTVIYERKSGKQDQVFLFSRKQ